VFSPKTLDRYPRESGKNLLSSGAGYFLNRYVFRQAGLQMEEQLR
jgi:hypothetical protein